MRLRPFALAALALLAAGCDGTTDDDFTSQVAVSAFLGTNEPLPPVTLSRTQPLLQVYSPEAAAVQGAEVRVTLLAADGSDETVYAYAPGPEPGQYLASDPEALVLPQRRYRLDVAADGATLTATTLVPPDFEVLDGPPETTLYGEGNGPEITITRSSTPERRAAFVASTRALAPVEFEEITVDGETRYRSVEAEGRYRPVPLLLRFLDCVEEGEALVCEDDPRELNAETGVSPVINEASYIDLGEGCLLVQVPFLAFGYFGPQAISLVSLDAAMQDFVQTQAVQGGGSTLSPGEIPNITTNVQGGLGVFGSYSRESGETLLVPPTFP